MQFDERTITSAGVALALAIARQSDLRDWVVAIEPDMVYHDPDGLR